MHVPLSSSSSYDLVTPHPSYLQTAATRFDAVLSKYRLLQRPGVKRQACLHFVDGNGGQRQLKTGVCRLRCRDQVTDGGNVLRLGPHKSYLICYADVCTAKRNEREGSAYAMREVCKSSDCEARVGDWQSSKGTIVGF